MGGGGGGRRTSSPVCLLSLWCEHPCMAAAITSTHVNPPPPSTSPPPRTLTVLQHTHTSGRFPSPRTLTMQPSEPHLNPFLVGKSPLRRSEALRLTKTLLSFPATNVFTQCAATYRKKEGREKRKREERTWFSAASYFYQLILPCDGRSTCVRARRLLLLQHGDF